MAGNVRQDEVQLRVVIDGSPARKELAQLAQESVKLQDEMKGMKKGSEEFNRSMERMATIGKRQDELRKELGLTGLSLKELRGLAAKLEAQLKTMVPGSEQWVQVNGELLEVKTRIDAVGSAVGRQAVAWEAIRQQYKLTEMSVSQLVLEEKRLKQILDTTDPNTPEWKAYSKELQGVTAQKQKLHAQMSGGQQLWSSLKSNVGGVVTSMVGISAAVYAAFQVFRDAAARIMEFDKGLSRIRALGGEYKAEIDAIGASARTAGIEFGFTAGESLKAVEAMAKAGVSAQDILGGGLQGVLALAATGNRDVAASAETASKAMTQFGLSGRDIPRLADLLAAAANTATGDVGDLSAALAQSGTVLNQYGVPIEDAVGTLTAFASAGLLGSDAGTSFKTMLTRLGAPTEDARAKMDALGISTYDQVGNFRTLKDIAGQLRTQLGTLSAEERNAALSTIFGSDAIRAASILYNQGAEGIASYVKQVDQLGFAQKQAAEQTNNLSGDIDRLSAAWGNFVLGVEQGDGIIGSSLRSIIQAVTGTLEFFGGTQVQAQTDAFAKNVNAAIANSFGKLELKMDEGQLEQVFQNEVFKVQSILKEDSEFIRNRMNDYAAEATKLGARAGQLSNEEVLRLNVIAEAQRMLLKSLQAKTVATKQDTDATAAAAQEETAQGETLATLREDLKLLKEERENLSTADQSWLDANGRAIKGLEDQIAKLEGTEKATKKVTDGMLKLRDQLADIRADLYRDALTADEADLAGIDQKYEKLRAAILAEETHTAEDLKALDEVYNQERANAIETQGQKRLDAYEQLALEARKRRQDAEDRLNDRSLTPKEAEVQQTLSEFDVEAANFKEGSDEMIQLRDQYEKKLTAIEAKYAKERTDIAKAERLQKIQNFTDTAQAVGSAVGGLQAILAASAAAQGKSSAEQSEFQRQLALTQIGIATAVGIANALSNIHEPFPLNVIAIATSIGAVMAGIGQAMGVLNSTPPAPQAPGAGPSLNNVPLGADGMVLSGPSHEQKGLKVYDPLRKRVVAEVEGGELLMSKRFTDNNQPILPLLLEASRKGTRLNFISSPLQPINTGAVRQAMVPAYALGGRLTRGTALVNAAGPGSGGSTYMFKKGRGGASDTGGGPGGGTPPWAAAMLAKMERVAQAAERFPSNLKATVKLGPVKDREEARYTAVKNRNTFRRSA